MPKGRRPGPPVLLAVLLLSQHACCERASELSNLAGSSERSTPGAAALRPATSAAQPVSSQQRESSSRVDGGKVGDGQLDSTLVASWLERVGFTKQKSAGDGASTKGSPEYIPPAPLVKKLLLVNTTKVPAEEIEPAAKVKKFSGNTIVDDLLDDLYRDTVYGAEIEMNDSDPERMNPGGPGSNRRGGAPGSSGAGSFRRGPRSSERKVELVVAGAGGVTAGVLVGATLVAYSFKHGRRQQRPSTLAVGVETL